MEQIPESNIEQKESLPPRNLKTHPEETIKAIAEVEGPAWLEQQESSEQSENSLASALERVQQGKKTVIYGRGGFNRWYMSTDGIVSFSESHAESPQHTEKVRSLGFDVVA